MFEKSNLLVICKKVDPDWTIPVRSWLKTQFQNAAMSIEEFKELNQRNKHSLKHNLNLTLIRP